MPVHLLTRSLLSPTTNGCYLFDQGEVMKRGVADGTFESTILVPDVLNVSVRSPYVVSTRW